MCRILFWMYSYTLDTKKRGNFVLFVTCQHEHEPTTVAVADHLCWTWTYIFSAQLLDCTTRSLTNSSSSRCANAEMKVDDDEDDMQLHDNAAAAADRPAVCSVSPRGRVCLASTVAAVGGVLFGYDTGRLFIYNDIVHKVHRTNKQNNNNNNNNK